MKTTSYLSLFYALAVLLLGIMGYGKAGSLVSLFTGLGFGILLLILSIASIQERLWAFFSIFLCSTLLIFVFGLRFSKNNNFMFGVMAAFSGLVAILNLLHVIWLRKKPRD